MFWFFGVNLVQNFMKQHKLFATIFNFDKTPPHNINDFKRYGTRVNGTPKTQRDNFPIISKTPGTFGFTGVYLFHFIKRFV